MSNWFDLHPLVQHDIVWNIFTMILLSPWLKLTSGVGEKALSVGFSLLGISYCDYIIMILISHLLSRDIIFIMMLHFSTSMWSICSFSYHIMTTCRSVCLCPFSRLFEARSRSPRRRPVNVFASKRCADVVCDMMLWSTHKSNQVFNSFVSWANSTSLWSVLFWFRVRTTVPLETTENSSMDTSGNDQNTPLGSHVSYLWNRELILPKQVYKSETIPRWGWCSIPLELLISQQKQAGCLHFSTTKRGNWVTWISHFVKLT